MEKKFIRVDEVAKELDDFGIPTHTRLCVSSTESWRRKAISPLQDE